MPNLFQQQPELFEVFDDMGGETGYLMSSGPSLSLQSNLAPVSYLSTADVSPWIQSQQMQQLGYQAVAYEDEPTMAVARNPLLPLRSSFQVEGYATPVTTARHMSTTATPIQFQPVQAVQPIKQATLVKVATPPAVLPVIAPTRVLQPTPRLIKASPVIQFAQPAPTAMIRLPFIRRF